MTARSRSLRAIGPGRRFPAPSGRETSLDTRTFGRNVAPPSSDAVKYAFDCSRLGKPSVLRKKTPTTPSGFTAMTGRYSEASAGAEASTRCGLDQVEPRSEELERNNRYRPLSRLVHAA